MGNVVSTRSGSGRRFHRCELDVVRPLGAARRYATGDVVFREGDEGSTVYLIESGLVRSALHAGGHLVAVSTAWPGELLGAVDALAGEPRGATATAAAPSRALAIPGAAFADLVDRDAQVRRAVLHQMSADVAALQGRLVAQCSQHIVVRVATTLLALSVEVGTGNRLSTTQSVLAEWIGATRESTARALAELRHRGWITTGRGWIRIDDREALVHFATC